MLVLVVRMAGRVNCTYTLRQGVASPVPHGDNSEGLNREKGEVEMGLCRCSCGYGIATPKLP